MRSEAINVGRGYPGQIAGTYATALQSGNSAANSTLANTATGASTMGTGTQWQGLGNQSLGGWTNALNSGYNAQLGQFNANQQASSGIGGLLGMGLGFASNAGWAFEDGGAVPEVTPGGKIPPSASPTRGAAIDDVDAKLTAGEFVMPKDVVQWKGEEFFQKVIDQSRKSKPQAPAQPQYAIAPAGNPTFSSRPNRPLKVGPTLALPSSEWQVEQPAWLKVSSPSSASGIISTLRISSATQALNASGLCTTTRLNMSECEVPQYSAQ